MISITIAARSTPTIKTIGEEKAVSTLLLLLAIFAVKLAGNSIIRTIREARDLPYVLTIWRALTF